MLLEIEDVEVHYAGAIALKDISLKLGEGEVTSIIGANGAGKTTLINTISGLNVPTSGQIYFQGKRIDGMSPYNIVALGIAQVPEGRRLFLDMTALDNLRMGAYLRRDREINKDLEKVYYYFPILKERQRQPSSSLSGGEQQMLAIARSLMSRPKLLLLDEPSVGLAPLMVQQISKVIEEVNQDGVSILLAEQNVGMALRLASKACVFETGSIILQGSSKKIMQDERVKKAYLGG